MGSGTVSGGHTYTEAGVYTVTLEVEGFHGESDWRDSEFVVVYDPNGGFVTGGGWLDSPPGAFIDDPALVGKATFGFVSKYRKGAAIPDGNTEFRFRAGDLNFHSLSYDWLVVTGSNAARFKGRGAINGGLAPSGSAYRFMIWAHDSDPDTFRIKIWWEKDGEQVVYDNGSGQPIEAGRIVVHS